MTRIKLKNGCAFQGHFRNIQVDPKAPCTCRKYDVRWSQSQNMSSDGSDPTGAYGSGHICHLKSFCIVLSNFSPTRLTESQRDFWRILYLQKNNDSFLPNSSSLMFNPLKPELNPICYLLALLAHHFLHVSRIRVKSLTLRWLMSYIYGAPILDVSRSHTTTQHSR